MNKFRNLVVLLLIAIAALGMWRMTAADGYANFVLEITEEGSNVSVRTGPGTDYALIERLLWGDRVLSLGNSAQGSGYTWYEVVLGSGQVGWMAYEPGWAYEAEMFYTTPGIRVGKQITILPDGNGSHLRELPSTYVDEVQTLRSGDTLYVINGPYQTEYQLWWNLRLPDGREGWLIDIPGWMQVSN